MPPMKLQNSNSGSRDGGGGGDMSDGDVSGAESERSNSSRENRDSSDEEPDSDDSSEMDEGECESRRTQLLQHVQDLEGQFSLLREQLYRERMAQVSFSLFRIIAFCIFFKHYYVVRLSRFSAPG